MLDWVVKTKFRRLFENKVVAIVGNGPNLIGRTLGESVDSNDIVVRINLVQPLGRERDIGLRTDVRVIGATMLEQHIPYVADLSQAGAILTTEKNKNFMESLGLQCSYYPSFTPKYALSLFKEIYGARIKIPSADKPPRTGIVFLSLLLRYGHARKVTLYGFSLAEGEITQALNFANDGIRTYETSSFQRNHCDPLNEMELLRQLEKLGGISIHR